MKVQNYKIIKNIGHSGISTLYQAKKIKPEQDVTLKVIPANLAQEDDINHPLLPLQDHLSSLEHSNIATAYACGTTESQDYYLVTEYFSGGSLKDRISQEPLSIEETLEIMEQMGSALDYIHAEGFIHYEVNPSNILFRDTGEAVLSDCYLSAYQHKLEEVINPNTLQNSLAYMCPEQTQDSPLDSRSDIYKLGLVFYEMLTGEKVVNAKTTVQAIYQHAVAPTPELPAEYSTLQGVLDKLLAKNPESRYSTAKVFLTSLKIAIQKIGKKDTKKQTTQTDIELSNTESQTLNSSRPKLSMHQADGVKGDYHLSYTDDEQGDTSKSSKGVLAAVLLIAVLGGLYFFNSLTKIDESQKIQLTKNLNNIEADRQENQSASKRPSTSPTEIVKISVKAISKKSDNALKATYYIKMKDGTKLGKDIKGKKLANFDLFPGQYEVFAKYKDHPVISKSITVTDQTLDIVLQLDLKDKEVSKKQTAKTASVTIKAISSKNKLLRSTFSIKLKNGEQLGKKSKNKKSITYELFPGEYEVLVKHKDFPVISKQITVEGKPQDITIQFNLESLSDKSNASDSATEAQKNLAESKKIKVTVKAISGMNKQPLKATYFIQTKAGLLVGEKLRHMESGSFDLLPGEYEVFARYKKLPMKGRTIIITDTVDSKEVLFTLGAL